MRYLLALGIILLASPCFAVLTRTYTVKESGGDYSTLQSAETAHNQDLVANDSALTFEISGTWTGVDAAAIFSGWTTDATRFITVTAIGDSRATATWNTSAYITQGVFDVLFTNEVYTVFDGIQVSLTTTDATGRHGITGGVTGVVIKNCFVKGSTGTGTVGIFCGVTSATGIVVRNNIVIDIINIAMQLRGAAGGVTADNNTLENSGVGVTITTSEDVIVRNTIFLNVTTPISGSPNTTTLSEENWTDNASITYTGCGSCGTGDQLSQSDPFVSLAGENYSLASGSTPIDAGKDLSGAFTDAIGGKTRDANFDKGADEFIAAAGKNHRRRRGAANSFLEPITPERQAFAWLFKTQPKVIEVTQ